MFDKTAEHKPKAYFWHDVDGTCEIVWTETAGQAKRQIADEWDLEFTEVRVQRIPWADKYSDMDEIPPKEYWAAGWWIHCADCEARLYEDEAVVDGNTVYCHKCWKQRTEGVKWQG